MLLESGWVKHRTLFLFLGVISSALVGWFDYVTTDQVNLSFFYLIPILFTTVAIGRTGGLGMALACAVIKIGTDIFSEQPYARTSYYMFNGFGLFVAFATFSMLLDMLRASYKRECDLHQLDGLTGLPNRQNFIHVTGDEWEKHKQSKSPYTIIVFDIDNFREFNNANGHHVGDIALQTLALSASKALNGDGILYRIGGDDFAVTFNESSAQKAQQAANHLHQRLAATIHDKCWRLSVSICTISCIDFSISVDDMVFRASGELHKAKQERGAGVLMELSC